MIDRFTRTTNTFLKELRWCCMAHDFDTEFITRKTGREIDSLLVDRAIKAGTKDHARLRTA